LFFVLFTFAKSIYFQYFSYFLKIIYIKSTAPSLTDSKNLFKNKPMILLKKFLRAEKN